MLRIVFSQLQLVGEAAKINSIGTGFDICRAYMNPSKHWQIDVLGGLHFHTCCPSLV
jgi:hypothetical protein